MCTVHELFWDGTKAVSVLRCKLRRDQFLLGTVLELLAPVLGQSCIYTQNNTVIVIIYYCTNLY